MEETANILHHASERSLVLMDEIGRGTSTFDGLSLAWACGVELATQNRAFTLFATHYFELTTLSEEYPGIANVHLSAVEHGDSIVFMYTVREGPAKQSYGLQVARLAGVPTAVIERARARLRELEDDAQRHREREADQLSLFPLESPAPNPILDALGELDPDGLSPRQALEALYRLQALAKGCLYPLHVNCSVSDLPAAGVVTSHRAFSENGGRIRQVACQGVRQPIAPSTVFLMSLTAAMILAGFSVITAAANATSPLSTLRNFLVSSTLFNSVSAILIGRCLTCSDELSGEPFSSSMGSSHDHYILSTTAFCSPCPPAHCSLSSRPRG